MPRHAIPPPVRTQRQMSSESEEPAPRTRAGSSEQDAVGMVLGLTERLFDQDEDKEITFELADGLEKAHKNVLKASSEVWKCMLESQFKEQHGIIAVKDVPRVSMRVFLRLIYTAHVNAADWKGYQDTPHSKSDDTPCESQDALPLRILLDVAMLSKCYIVKPVFSMAVQALKVRLTTAHKHKDRVTFERIMSAAITNDLAAVRLAALDEARKFTDLKAKYDAKALCPEVQSELEAIWPTPEQSVKRNRLQ